MADVRFVSDDRDPGPLGNARDLGNDGSRSATRRQRVDRLRARTSGQAAGEQVGGLPAPRQRAGDDQVDLEAEGGGTGDCLAEAFSPVGVSGRIVSSGQSGPRSAATAWRTR